MLVDVTDIPGVRQGDEVVLIGRQGEESITVEQVAERQLLRANGRLSADVVVVPHHGSRTSSSAAFVEAVAPTVAVASAGYANRWGFPVPVVIDRWESVGARMLNTASEGAVFMRICADRGVVELSGERQTRRRFWHAES